MGILGLGNKDKAKRTAKAKPGAKKAGAAESAQSKEAKAVLAKMQAKKDAGDCPFC